MYRAYPRPSTSHSVAKQQANDVSANYDSDANKEADALALWQAKPRSFKSL